MEQNPRCDEGGARKNGRAQQLFPESSSLSLKAQYPLVGIPVDSLRSDACSLASDLRLRAFHAEAKCNCIFVVVKLCLENNQGASVYEDPTSTRV